MSGRRDYFNTIMSDQMPGGFWESIPFENRSFKQAAIFINMTREGEICGYLQRFHGIRDSEPFKELLVLWDSIRDLIEGMKTMPDVLGDEWIQLLERENEHGERLLHLFRQLRELDPKSV